MTKAKKPTKTPSDAPKKKGKPMVTTGTWIALGALIPVSVLFWNMARSWYALKNEVAGQQAQVNATIARNGTLEPIYDVLQNRRFQICNRTAYQIKVPWLAAAYHDGKQVKLFESARCREWQELVIPAGDNKIVTLSSGQEGCNWNGSVMYYAMRLYRQVEDEDKVVERPYDYMDMYRGFDRDCFTLQ